MRTTLLAIALLLSTSAHAEQVPKMEGLWTTASGRALHFAGDTVVMVDKGQVVILKWSFGRAEPGYRFPMTLELIGATDRKGAALKVAPKARKMTAMFTMPVGVVGPSVPEICFTGALTKRLLGKTPHCSLLERAAPGKSLDACVRACVQRNSMHATGPDVIEGDCRIECGGR